MFHRRHRIYWTLSVLCISGYLWLAWNSTHAHTGAGEDSYCPTRQLTGIPCPACGTTRSVMSLAEADFQKAFLTNPMGYPVAAALLLLPLWMLFDLIAHRRSLADAYQRAEVHLRQRRWAIPLIAAMIINWCWNISKGL